MMRRPWHIWVVSLSFIALSANGAWDQAMLLGGDARYMDMVGLNQAQREYYADYPLAVAILWGLSITSGLAAGTALLFGRRIAFALGLVALGAQVLLLVVTTLGMSRLQIFGWGFGLFDFAVLLLTLVFTLYVAWTRRRGFLYPTRA